jgi:hypothetical protein
MWTRLRTSSGPGRLRSPVLDGAVPLDAQEVVAEEVYRAVRRRAHSGPACREAVAFTIGPTSIQANIGGRGSDGEHASSRLDSPPERYPGHRAGGCSWPAVDPAGERSRKGMPARCRYLYTVDRAAPAAVARSSTRAPQHSAVPIGRRELSSRPRVHAPVAHVAACRADAPRDGSRVDTEGGSKVVEGLGRRIALR